MSSRDVHSNREDRYGPKVFIHIPKTAGTFARSLIEQSEHEIGYAYGTGPYKMLDRMSEDELHSIRLKQYIFGHQFLHTYENYIPDVSDYSTIMRHPADRVISFYNHAQNFLLPPGASKMSLLKFLNSRFRPQLQDCQVRFLCGHPIAGRYPNVEDLDAAIANVRNGLVSVGIQELMASSLRHLPIFSCINVPSSKEKLNESNFGFRKESFTELELNRIREMVSLDFELYEYCVARLRSRQKLDEPKVALGNSGNVL